MRLIRLCFLALAFLTGAFAIAAAANAEPYVYQGGNEEESASPGKLFVGDGEAFEKLPFYGSSPSLAPDRERIVFYSEALGEEGLAITDLDGHGPHIILPPSVELLNHYEWAPDGSEIIASTLSNGTIVSLHPSSTSWEWEVKPILPWEGRAYDPTISPDGSKIAFAAYSDATGKELGNPALFIANRNGSEVEQLTSPPAYASLEPSFSPDGKEIAFKGVAETAPYTDIYSINLETKEVTDLTSTPAAAEWNPDFLADGRIAFADSAGFDVMDANGEHKESLRTFSGKEVSYGASWPQIQGDLPTLGPETKEEATKLLLRYTPKMRYHSIESFYAMNWHPITEIYSKKSTKESNRLIRSEAEKSEVVAYANPALSLPNLNWEFLKPSGGKYPNEKVVKGGDRLSERTSGEAGALADIEEDEINPAYSDRAYGRVKYDGGRWWLQYWLWYYYQPFLEGFGDHEGDWEMVQIGLNEDGLPELATYAEHSGGESCAFAELPTSIGYYGNLGPDVFVSYGVHASYTNTEHLGVGEVTNGAIPVNPQVANMYDTENWVQWPGKWGDSETSPGAPSIQGTKWSAPDKFYEEGGECTASSGLRPNHFAQKKQTSPLPDLSATRAGDVVTVSYHLSENAQPRPKWILVKVSESGGIPIGGNYRVHGNSGQVQIEIPFKGGQLVAMAQTLDREGHSEVVETPVR